MANPMISVGDLQLALANYFAVQGRDVTCIVKAIAEAGTTWKSAAKAIICNVVLREDSDIERCFERVE